MGQRVTRRTFLTRSGLALAALSSGSLFRPVRAMGNGSQILWRGVAIGPGGIGGEQQYQANRRFFAETGTPWVRMWADWPVLQPERDRAPDRGSGAAALARLDQGVAQARADGLRVMLTAWRFPRWANGTDVLPPEGGLEPTFKLPEDLSSASDWGRWIDFLIGRYGAGNVEALELLNEPNLQLWPQAAAVDAVARMFTTAQIVAGGHLDAPFLVGPATADVVGDTPLRTGYDTFTRALLDRLDAQGFAAGPRFAWSHHSYGDLEEDLSGPENRTAAVRAMLLGRWAGWPVGDPAAPGVLVTETGARLDKIASLYGLGDPAAVLQRQAELIERYWRRMQFGPEGAGAGMVCQYLFVTDANYDSGLCGLDGAPRPAYYAWGRLPAFQ